METTCWTCRRRRVRCDSHKPECQKCKSKGIECLGYGDSKPLMWVNEAQRKKRRRKRVDADSTSGTSANTPVASWPDSDSDCSIEGIVRSKTPENVSDLAVLRNNDVLEAVQKFGMNYLPPEMMTIVRCMEYYNRCISCTTSPIVSDQNLFRMTPYLWHHAPSIVLDTLVLVIARQRQIRAQYSITPLEQPSHAQVFEDDINRHTTSAIVRLNSRLNSVQKQKEPLTLFCVFIILLSELQRSSRSRNWKMHLEGARSVIDLHGGTEVLSRASDKGVRNFMIYFILIDVIRLTTTDIRNETANSADIQRSYLPLIPALFNNGVWTVMPCPEGLLRSIVKINDLRLQTYNTTYSCLPTIRAEARDILIQVTHVDTQQWAFAAVMIQDLAPKLRPGQWNECAVASPVQRAQLNAIRETREKDFNLWQSIARVYQSAVILYLIRSLLYLHFSFDSILLADSSNTLAQLRMQRQRTLDQNLDILFEARNSNIPFYLYTTWPLLIAGLETDPTDAEKKRRITNRLTEMGATFGAHSMLDACDFLRQFWQRQAETGELINWNEMFEHEEPCVFLI